MFRVYQDSWSKDNNEFKILLVKNFYSKTKDSFMYLQNKMFVTK